jgi:hypothetical protein
VGIVWKLQPRSRTLERRRDQPQLVSPGTYSMHRTSKNFQPQNKRKFLEASEQLSLVQHAEHHEACSTIVIKHNQIVHQKMPRLTKTHTISHLLLKHEHTHARARPCSLTYHPWTVPRFPFKSGLQDVCIRGGEDVSVFTAF